MPSVTCQDCYSTLCADFSDDGEYCSVERCTCQDDTKFEAGVESGYNSGYTDGKDEGSEDSYNAGYDDGFLDGQYSVHTLVTLKEKIK